MKKEIMPGQYRNELLNGKGLRAVVRDLGWFQGERAVRLGLGEFDTEEKLWRGLTVDGAFAVAVACGADETLISLAACETVRSIADSNEQRAALRSIEQGIIGFASRNCQVLDEAIALVRASGVDKAKPEGSPEEGTAATKSNAENVTWVAINSLLRAIFHRYECPEPVGCMASLDNVMYCLRSAHAAATVRCMMGGTVQLTALHDTANALGKVFTSNLSLEELKLGKLSPPGSA